MSRLPKVVIVGAGFAGLNAAKALKLTPLVIWGANSVMLLIAVFLFRRLARN